jgi:hypothetical protein
MPDQPTPDWDDLSPEDQGVTAGLGWQISPDLSGDYAQDLVRIDEMMRRRNGRLAKIEHLNQVFLAAHRQLQQRHEEAVGTLQGEVDYYEGQISAWHWENHLRGRAAATLTLPMGGTSEVYSNTNVQPEVTDRAALDGFLAEHGLDDKVIPMLPPAQAFRKGVLNKLVSAQSDPRAAEPGSKIPATFVTEDGEPVEVPGLAYVAPDRKWKGSW